MQITIRSIHFNANQKLLNFIKKKINKLTRFNDELISIDIFLRLENASDKNNKLVEVKINTGFNELFVSKKRESFEESIDLVQDILIRLVKKNKQKKRLI
tara:strand:- start:179 stop:478 length:300 start_codon:yes stop_codon:yes gene_type:complete